jgi:hypothetical protein
MSTTDTKTGATPGTCITRVDGPLGERALPWCDGLTVTTEGSITVMHGPVADQAAPLGLLLHLRYVGLPLISVARVHPEGGHKSSAAPTSHLRT